MISPSKKNQRLDDSRNQKSQRRLTRLNFDIKNLIALQNKVNNKDLQVFLKHFSKNGLISIDQVLKVSHMMKFNKQSLKQIEIALKIINTKSQNYLLQQDLGFLLCNSNTSKTYQKKQPFFKMIQQNGRVDKNKLSKLINQMQIVHTDQQVNLMTSGQKGISKVQFLQILQRTQFESV